LTALATTITSEIGLDDLTIREVARRAGVFPTVVYHHIGDLEAVRFAVADAVIGSIEVPARPTSAPKSAWRHWFVELAEHAYDVLSRHQGVFPYIARTGPSSPSQIRIIDACVQVLSAAGLDDHDASLCYGALIHHVGSSADLHASFALLDPNDGRRDLFEQRLRNVAALHPGLQRALPHFQTWDHVEAYRYGLDLLLDGIEIRRRRRTPG
jgi:AcrR family transcriptional regulator